MNIEEVIKTRRTVHEFSGERVDQEIINKSMELATWAPNHKLTYPWQFFDLGPQAKNAAIELAVELKKNKSENFSEAMAQGLRNKLGSASHMIMIGLKISDNEFQLREDYATVACGVQNMSLYLHTQGLGSKWSTGGFTSHSKIYEILKVDHEQIDLVGCLLIGTLKPKQKLRVPPRPEASQFIQTCP